MEKQNVTKTVAAHVTLRVPPDLLERLPEPKLGNNKPGAGRSGAIVTLLREALQAREAATKSAAQGK